MPRFYLAKPLRFLFESLISFSWYSLTILSTGKTSRFNSTSKASFKLWNPCLTILLLTYLLTYYLRQQIVTNSFKCLFHFRLQIKLASFEIPFGNSAFGLLCRFCDWHRILLWKWKNCRQRMKGIRKRRERKRVGERKRKRERNCQIDMC